MAGRSRLRTDAESRAWEGLMRAYGGEDFVAADFAKLRDPAELGSVLDNDPPRFSMLTPKASLRAWLSFADDNNPHAAEALEGARKLSHRTSDAVAWLSHPYSDADGAFLMRHLLQLDLEATPELCRAGLAWVEDEFASAYRPTPNVRTWRNLRLQPQTAFWRIAPVRVAPRAEDVRPKWAYSIRRVSGIASAALQFLVNPIKRTSSRVVSELGPGHSRGRCSSAPPC